MIVCKACAKKLIICLFALFMIVPSFITPIKAESNVVATVNTSSLANIQNSKFLGIFGSNDSYDDTDFKLVSQCTGIPESSLRVGDKNATTGMQEGSDDMADYMYYTKWHVTHPIRSLFGITSWQATKFIYNAMSIGQDFFNVSSYQGLRPQFANTYVNTVVQFFISLSWMLYALGVVLAVLEESVRYTNGQGDFNTLIFNGLKGLIYTAVFVVLSVNIFEIACDTGIALANSISGQGSGALNPGMAGLNGVISTFLDMVVCVGFAGLCSAPTGFMIALMILITLIYMGLKIMFFFAKKVPQFLSMLAKGCIMPFFVARGNNSSVDTYLMQLGMFFLQIMMQFIFFSLGITLICKNQALDGSFNIFDIFNQDMILGLCILASANEIGGWIGGMSAEDDLGKTLHTLSHGASLVKTLNGFGGNSGGNGNSNQQSQTNAANETANGTAS